MDGRKVDAGRPGDAIVVVGGARSSAALMPPVVLGAVTVTVFAFASVVLLSQYSVA